LSTKTAQRNNLKIQGTLKRLTMRAIVIIFYVSPRSWAVMYFFFVLKKIPKAQIISSLACWIFRKFTLIMCDFDVWQYFHDTGNRTHNTGESCGRPPLPDSCRHNV